MMKLRLLRIKQAKTVNGYIKKAIEQRMENENGSVE